MSRNHIDISIENEANRKKQAKQLEKSETLLKEAESKLMRKIKELHKLNEKHESVAKQNQENS